MKLVIAGLIVAVSPFFLALTAGGSVWDEGNGGGAALWFLIFTIPLGGLLVLIGLIRLLLAKRRG